MPDLAVRDLTVRTRDGRVILRADRLDVAAGEALGIRGPSGAGKSTLLHAIAGLIAPATGSIRWGDLELAGLPEARRDAFRRTTIGLVFQEFLLFEELSALGNAAVAAAYAPALNARRSPPAPRRCSSASASHPPRATSPPSPAASASASPWPARSPPTRP